MKFKIQNPERFYFEPKELLINLATMYVNMGDKEKFRQNVIQDERSYSDETFEKTCKILTSTKKNVVINPEIREKFIALAGVLKKAKAEAKQEEVSNIMKIILIFIKVDYDDAPEEFLDPLMATLMDDPVELPSSRTIIDKITISKFIYL